MTIINVKKSGGTWARSSLEKKFEMLWESACPEYVLHAEQYLIPNRRFRCDYVHRESKVTIEIHGGSYMKNGGHTNAKGVQSDYEKNNLLTLMGFKNIYLGTSQITRTNIELIKSVIRQHELY